MDVRHVAKLANLKISTDEEEKFAAAFKKTLETIDVINELDTSNVKPTSQVTGLINVYRDDEIDEARVFPQSVVLGQASATYNGYLVVPSVFNEQ